ncbi:hypothetical protein P4O66_017119, partial [Electrophorus voltai]
CHGICREGKGTHTGSVCACIECLICFVTSYLLQLRNPQIKQSSLKRDNSMLRQKSIRYTRTPLKQLHLCVIGNEGDGPSGVCDFGREALEKNPLRFLLQGGKVTGLCPREAEQVWALNIKRAILSMLQTSHSERARETVRETDVYGTCTSSYEQKGPSLVKTRYIQQCLRERVNDFWWQSVPLKEDTVGPEFFIIYCTDVLTVNASLKCTQLYGTTMMDKVNCTETMTLVPLSGSLDQVQTTTVSTLTLLRTLEGIKVDSGLQDEGYLTDLRFKVETENPARGGARSAQEVSGTVRRLCAHSAEQEQQSELFLSLVLQLRTLTLQQLKDVWQEVSFKCRDDWQPLVEALPACGSETCIHFTTSLILNNEIDQDHSISFLSAITFAPHPTLSMISHIRVSSSAAEDKKALLKFPLLRPKTILALSSLVHHICQKEHISCSEIPEVQQFVRILKESLEQGCGGQGAPGITELLHVLKAVGNIGEAVGALIPQLNICIRNHSVPLELRIAAVQAFRRIPCHSERGVLAWAYEHPHEDVEVRISAYQQLMHCPDQEVFKIIRATLRNETSTQVGSFVWSHLFNLQKTEDPLKKDLMESLPHDIISKDFEAEPWKYSSHMDFTMDTGVAVANVEGALVFSHMSLLPRSAMANMTVHILGRSFNLFEVENNFSILNNLVHLYTNGQHFHSLYHGCFQVSLRMENAERFLWSTFEGPDAHDKKSAHNTKSAPRREKRKKRSEERWSDPQGRRDENANCHIPSPPNTKGQEVKVNYRAIALAEELVLPSLSGVPIKLSINISSSCSLGVKGTANFKDWSQFSLAGYIKPNAFIAISARIGVDGALGRSGLEWVTWVRTSTSMDGGAYVHNGQSLKMVLNMPEDVMDIMSFSSRMYHVSGESREELTVSRTLKEKTTCTPKTWSKMLGCQLCSDVIYPVSLIGRGFPPPGPVLFTLRFQKLDKGLQKYILEAAYAFVPQRTSWLPLETNLLIFFGTPQSTIPRDVSLDFSVSPQRLNLKITHPLKTILIQGQINELNGLCTGRAELRIDDSYYYLKLGRRQDDGQRQYSMDAVILLPNILSMRTLGMLGHRGPDWSFGLRVRYGVSEDSQNKGECHISQNLRDEVGLDEKHYSMQAEHELVCSHITSINHKIQLRHERSPIHIQSSLDLSYGKHWNQASNKERVLLSQSIRNQSGPSLTSYALEFSLRIPEQRLNYRIQLLHSHQKRRKSESSTHLKVNYNDQIPLVAGLHWKDMSTKASLRKWEGSFNMDTPWLYVHMAPKLTQPQYGTTHFTSEITTRKWITIHNLMMEGLYRERNRDVEWQLHFFTPTVTYLKVGGGGMLGKHSVNASCCISTAWTPALRGEILLGDGKQLKTLDVNTRYGKQTLNISASLNTLDKKLKKKLVVMSMTLSELNSPYLELEIRGRVEEMRKDKYLYQKRWVLHFRQPFRFLPQSLLLQETFTIDLHKGLYILESKTLLHDNRKAIHILTLGSRSHHPHTVWELQGRIWAAKKERLVVLGQLQLPSEASQQSIVVKFNLTQLLQAYLAVKRSPDGKISNSIYIGSDGKLCAVLDVSLANTIQTGVHAVVFDLSFQQTLLPVLTTDGHINLRANSSSKSFSGLCVLRKREELFRAELSVAVVRDPELQLSLSGDLIISLPGFPLLPHVSSLIGFFNNSKALTKGELTVMVDEAAYGVELTHGHGDVGFGGMNGGEMTWLCALAQGHWLCINISRSSGQDIHNGLQAQVSHSVPWLLSADESGSQSGAHGWGLEVRLEREALSKRGDVLVDWTLGGEREQMRSVLPLVDAQGCILVAQEGKASYSQRAELKWSDKSITQSMKYERGAKGMHTVQVEAGVQNVSPRPCPSHTLRAKMHTNLRDIIEHHILLGLCPPQPALSWSGSHRVNSGKVMLHSQTVLSVVGQAPLSAFTLALRNSSSSQRGNYSLLAQWKVGNWSAELSTSVHSSERTTGLQLQAGLDHGELLWLQARRGKRCLQAAAGYVGDSSDDLRTALCLEERHWLTLEVQRGGSSIENEALALISMGIANRSLIFQAKGCEECLLATEARLQQLRTHIRRKLLERVQKVHHLLLDVKRQAGGSGALQELCDGPLRLARRAEHLLLRPAPLPWEHRPLGHVLSHGLPQFLQWLHDMSQLVQQELRKPLTTLAGAYHDVTGERLDTLWHQGLQIWSRELAQLLPEVLHYQHLRAPALTALQTTIAALDLVGQQTVHWAEARFAAMLVGVRRQLALMYKFSRRDEEVRVKIPLPRNPWPKGSGANVVEVLLEEFLLKPLLALNSASLTADLYRLKRRLMDSPFNHQAFLVADEFAVSFDGHLFAVPAFCNLILASDVTKNTFSIMLQSNGPKQRSLVVQLKNTTVKIHPNAQVEANCHGVHTPFTNHDVTIMREMNLLIVSNRKGLLVSCDPYVRVCRITLEGWLHGLSSGLLGTNDNEAGNERPLPDGSQAPSMTEFMLAWQLGSPQTGSSCIRARGGACQTRSMEEPSCALLFSSTSSPLSACFRVVDPEQFLAVCESSVCGSVDVSSSAPCRLSSAYIQLCLRNYVPLEMPIQCGSQPPAVADGVKESAVAGSAWLATRCVYQAALVNKGTSANRGMGLTEQLRDGPL